MSAVATPPRLMAARAAHLDEHHRCFGPRPELPVGALAGLLHEAGLTGRGGAGFPTGRKLAAVRGPDAVVVGNGAEGEPLSGKDAWLLGHVPHLVLDGLHLAATDVTARDVYLYVPERATDTVQRAIDERRRAGATERVHIVTAPDTFVAGEKSAVVSRVQGGPPLPTDQVVSTSVRGVKGRPTLVSNVETLAHMALIARYGPRWFRAVGDPADPGTTLVTLSGALTPAVHEAPTGITLSEVVARAGRTDPRRLSAVLLGGYHGRWVPQAGFDRVRLGRGSGTGIIHGLAVDECGVAKTAAIVDYLAEQSAGVCGPCVNGLPRLAGLMRELADGPGNGVVGEIMRIAGLVDGRGACHHPDGTARLVRSALDVFCVDIALHTRGQCVAATPIGRPA